MGVTKIGAETDHVASDGRAIGPAPFERADREAVPVMPSSA